MSGRSRQFLLNATYGLIRLALCGIFFYAGVVKLQTYQDFAIIIKDLRLVPDSVVVPAAIILPMIEVLAALGLFFDMRGALAIISLLLILFISVLGYAIWLGLDVDCGCFGPEDPEFYAYEGLYRALYRDLVMLAGAVLLYVIRCFNSVKLLRVDDLLKAVGLGRNSFLTR